MRTVAIIPAAGSGIRMGSGRAKQFLDLAGSPLLAITLKAFQDCRSVDAIILVVPTGDEDYCKKDIVEKFKFNKVKKVVNGGKRRQDSVRLGLEATDAEYGLVIIHDGVRPIINPEFIDMVIAAARTDRAVITGLPAKDTVKEINGSGQVVETYDRQRLWLVQTPQAFRYEDIMAAHNKATIEGWDEATDDSILVERMGIPVKVIEGSESNIKVTTPNDLKMAGFLI